VTVRRTIIDRPLELGPARHHRIHTQDHDRGYAAIGGDDRPPVGRAGGRS
jgi:hypothetical protein